MAIKIKLVLVGPREGQTILINNVQFNNGACDVMPTGEPTAFFNYWATYYNAHPFGSDSYNDAVKEYKELMAEIKKKEVKNESIIPKTVENPDSDPLSTKPAKDGDSKDNESTGDGSESISSDDADGRDKDAEGNGLSEKILEAFTVLDDENSEHWTEGGKPMVDVIADLTGVKTIKRADIESAQPGFRRWHEDDDDVKTEGNE